jgi:5-methylcytosine-specific restriction endonuclease McrA
MYGMPNGCSMVRSKVLRSIRMKRDFCFNNFIFGYTFSRRPVSRVDLSNQSRFADRSVCFKAAVMFKRCTKCETVKLLNQFSPDKRNRDGRKSHCKACVNLYMATIKDRVITTATKWQKDNPEKKKAISRKWHHKHKDERKTPEHKAKRAEYSRNYRAENPEKVKQYIAEYRKSHPSIFMVFWQNRRARIKGNGGTVTMAEIESLKKKQNYTCLCCLRREPEIELTHDHVKPLAMGGENTIANSQMLCRSCNSRKGTKHIDYR